MLFRRPWSHEAWLAKLCKTAFASSPGPALLHLSKCLMHAYLGPLLPFTEI